MKRVGSGSLPPSFLRRESSSLATLKPALDQLEMSKTSSSDMQAIVAPFNHLDQARIVYDLVQEHNVTQGPNKEPAVTLIQKNANPVPSTSEAASTIVAHQVDLYDNAPLFEKWLEEQGLIASRVSGQGLNCLINALIQHATGRYNKEVFEEATVIRDQISDEFPDLTDALYDDAPYTKRIVELVHAQYGVQLRVCFIQCDHEGHPAIASIIHAGVSEAESCPVVIWQQGGHYVSITTKPYMESLNVASKVEHQLVSSQSSSQEESPIEKHYRCVRAYAEKRTWTEEGLHLEINAEQVKQLESACAKLTNRAHTCPPTNCKIVKIEEDGLIVQFDDSEIYEDPRITSWYTLAMKLLIEQDQVSLAQHIFDHLHELGVETYLLKKAKRFEKKKKFLQATRYYRALSMMHPFEASYYVSQITMFQKIDQKKEILRVCQEGLKRLEAPHERHYLDSVLVHTILFYSSPLTLSQPDARKFLRRLLRLLQEIEIEREYLLILIAEASKLVAGYGKQIGFHDTPSLQFLAGLIEEMLKVVEPYQSELQEIYQYWGEQMMGVSIQSMIEDRNGEEDKKNYLMNMAIEFSKSSRIMHMYMMWCIREGYPEYIVELYEEHLSLENSPHQDSYYFAKAMMAQKENKSSDVIEGYLQSSYQAAPAGWTAYNLGIFLLRNRPADAGLYLQEAVRDHATVHRLLALWAFYILFQHKDQSVETLTCLEACDVALPLIQECYRLQKQGNISQDEIARCFSLVEGMSYTLSPQAVRKASIPNPYLPWIEKRKIDIADGYVGIPIHQKRADQMPKEIGEYYRSELEKKASKKESFSLPLTKHDCWVGEKGKNVIPRIDIEEYHEKGNMPHFQRFRFQQGSKTYGGLRLPTGRPIQNNLVLAAFKHWIKSEKVYLVIFHPDHYPDLTVIHREIFLMDLDNH